MKCATSRARTISGAILLAVGLHVGPAQGQQLPMIPIHRSFDGADSYTRTSCLAVTRAVHRLNGGRSNAPEFKWDIEVARFIGIDAKDANLRRLWDTVAAAPEERFVPAVFAIFTYCTTGQ